MADPATGTASQERVLCWACERDWSRRDGLRCICGSDCTEVFAEGHDPRNDNEPEPTPHDTPQFLERERPFDHMLRSRSPHDHDHNNYLNAPDPPEDNIENFQVRQNGPHNYTVTGRIIRTVSPTGAVRGNRGPSPTSPTQGLFLNALSDILGAHGPAFGHPPPDRNQQGAPNDHEPRERPRSAGFQNQRQGDEFGHFQPHFHGAGQRLGGFGPQTNFVHTGPNHRFTYSTSARIYPRDASHAQAHVEPTDGFHEVFQQIFGPAGLQTGPRMGQPGQPGQPGQQQNALANNPLFGLLSTLFGPNSNIGNLGDFALTQQDLDRIIANLPPTTGGGAAPPPAPAEAIASLPKKKVTKDMLGSDGKAECTICLDPVNIGEELTVLLCTHWFHGPCVEAWLSEHNTCPHCRKPIDSAPNPTASAPLTPRETSSGVDPFSQASRSYPPTPPPRNMPGAFDDSPPVAGSGSRGNPYRVDDSASSHSRRPSRSERRAPSVNSSQSEVTGSQDGFGSRIRRSLFGSSHRHSGNSGQ